MFCKKCGNQVPEGASFCKNCGTAIETNNKPTRNNTDIGITPKGSNSKLNQCTLVILILQLLQIIFHFIPVLRVSIPSYGESESYSVKNGLYEGGFINVDLTSITYILVILAIISIAFSLLTLLGISKSNLFGNIIKFISWGFTSFWFVATWAYIYQYCMEAQAEIYAQVLVETTFTGILYHIINTLLFVSLCVSVFLNQKQSKH